MDSQRRKFLVLSLCTATSMLATQGARADEPMLSESDAQARNVGYTENAATVDRNKYSSYMPGQTCGTCSLFQAQADGKSGDCLLFSGKRVAAAGWCSSYSNM